MGRSKRCVIIPAYNEQKTIAQVVRGVINKANCDVIVVDDGSRDSTAKLAEEAGALVVSQKNGGYDAALSAGFAAAAKEGYQFVTTFDADGQHDPELLEKYFSPLENNECELVLGVRPEPARFAEHIMAFYFGFRFGVRDILCGMKGYNMVLYRQQGFFDSIKSIGAELTLRAIKCGCRFTQVHVPIHPRQDQPRFGGLLRSNLRIFAGLLRLVKLDYQFKYDFLFVSPGFFPSQTAASVRMESFLYEMNHSGLKCKVLGLEGARSRLYFKLGNNQDKFVIRFLKENLLGLEVFCRVLISSPKKIIISTPPYFVMMYALFAGFIRGKQIFLDVRDIYPDVLFQKQILSETSFLGRLISIITRFLQSRAALITVATEGLRHQVSKRLQVPISKVHLVRNGYDEEIFKIENEKMISKRILFHGTLGQFQNVELVLALADRARTERPDFEFVVAGEGPKAVLFKNPFRNIKFLGSVNYRQIPELISSCQLGLSFRDESEISRAAFPVKVYEYLGCGKPVLVTPLSEAGEMLEKSGWGYQFENHEFEKIWHRLCLMIDQKSEHTPDQQFRRQFSRQSQAKRFVELLTRPKVN